MYSAVFGTARFNQSYFNEINPAIFHKEVDIDIETEIDKSIGETN